MRSKRKHTTRRGLLLATLLTLILSLLASSTAAAQNSERQLTREQKQPTQIEEAPGPMTLSFDVDHGTNDGETVIFQAPTPAAGKGIAVGPPSCEFDCIARAWLSTNASTTAQTLHVEVDVEASIEYSVATHAPYLGSDGLPYFPVATTTGHTWIDTTAWTATVDHLAADTSYYIIVKATDEAGTHAEWGTFHTVTPVTQGIDTWNNSDAAGCSLECITNADLVYYPSHPDRLGWIVETLVPTRIVVSVSAEPIVWNNGIPGVSSLDAAAAEYNWTTEFSGFVDGLESLTDYNVIVAASDANGNTEFVVETIGTAAANFDLLYAPLRTIVHENGDSIGKGEVRFSWYLGTQPDFLFTGERARKKMSDGESFYFDNDVQYLIQNVAEDEILPDFRMYGKDNDPFGFETLGNPAAVHDWIWNGYFGAQRVGDVDQLPACGSLDEINSDHPFANSRCMRIENYPMGDDRVHFTTILAIHKTPASDQGLPPSGG